MSEKITVVALGHRALGTTLPEQKIATKKAAKAIADLVEAGNRVVVSHSNGPQIGMIHTAMNEFGKAHPDYTFAPMSVCSAMSQGYIGYDLQTAIRAELISRGIYKPVATILTHMMMLLQNRRRSLVVYSQKRKLKLKNIKETLLPNLQMELTRESLQLQSRRKL